VHARRHGTRVVAVDDSVVDQLFVLLVVGTL
jgi:hypothetical protein